MIKMKTIGRGKSMKENIEKMLAGQPYRPGKDERM